jgi:hypothetical protein
MQILEGGLNRKMWYLSAYEKNGDRLVRQHRLHDVDVTMLRRLWQESDDDPMYYSYPVTPAIAEALADHIQEPLQLDTYDYFLEYMSQEE